MALEGEVLTQCGELVLTTLGQTLWPLAGMLGMLALAAGIALYRGRPYVPVVIVEDADGQIQEVRWLTSREGRKRIKYGQARGGQDV